MSDLPSTHRVLLQLAHDSTELKLIERPLPVADPTDGQHLVRIHAFSPCSGERKWPANFPDYFNHELVPGYDISGVVVTAPPSSPYQPGTEIYARTSPFHVGCASDYALVHQSVLAPKPPSLTFIEAAGVPMSAQTAWQALFEQAGLKPEKGAGMGRRVLVTAASGGVGMWVVQLAAWIGATVVGTCGPDNLSFVRDLGATEVLNYRSEDIVAWGGKEENKVDLVVDCRGGKSLQDAWHDLKPNGTILSIFQPPEEQRPSSFSSSTDITHKFFVIRPDGEQLQKISTLIKDGKVKTVVDSVYPLEKFEEAYERADSGHAKGKVIVDLLA